MSHKNHTLNTQNVLCCFGVALPNVQLPAGINIYLYKNQTKKTITKITQLVVALTIGVLLYSGDSNLYRFQLTFLAFYINVFLDKLVLFQFLSNVVLKSYYQSKVSMY